ncbi:rod shape-determining protein MreD [Gracilibacillus ureilyticus]|uniref:Rod shape-determining protein MreD n=1 Tax=Gracilibacillus ureilyticus TaxID=531814 RepID=A0A1H9RPE2_9BACI|nr:rod shape-determining protein MreD [Gracilibacillus ureilyticus]SER74670.1 rod shape-determining protein MreD [Gracilibacillus ureilyticus]
MSRVIPFLLACICLFLIMLEGALANVLTRLTYIPENWQMVSHFMLIFTIYITVFFDRRNTYYSFLFAALFGLLVDILYTPIIGIYLFVYAASIYIIRNLMKWLHANLYVTVLVMIIGVFIADILAYFLYNIIQIHQMEWNVYLFQRLLPTISWNIIVGVVFYPLIKKLLKKWQYIKFQHKD